jgi:2-polyprenyl-6-methoxyphenol hydroxylase-like FAD-dependent oxidoreductase
MNTGIGDAVNLAWKLAAVVTGRADQSMLDSYEPERLAFARRLVATTDQAFTAVTSNRPPIFGSRGLDRSTPAVTVWPHSSLDRTSNK